MDILIVPAALDLLHQWKGTRIPNNRVLAIGGVAWVKAILKIATQAKEERDEGKDLAPAEPQTSEEEDTSDEEPTTGDS